MGLSNICFKIVQKADDKAGKLFNGINKKIRFNKVPEKLAQQLNDVGLNIAGKNAKREVIAAMNHQMQTNIDNMVKNGLKIATLDPEPDLIEAAAEAYNHLGQLGTVRNMGLAKAADNSRNMLNFRHENISNEARDVIKKYLQNPINVIKAYS